LNPAASEQTAHELVLPPTNMNHLVSPPLIAGAESAPGTFNTLHGTDLQSLNFFNLQLSLTLNKI
jgi:hypothetical protein